MKTYTTSILTILLTLLIVSSVSADPAKLAENARTQLSVAPQKVYPKMIQAVKTKDWDKLNNCIKILSPLSKEIDNTLRVKLTTELKQAISDRNADLAEKKVMEFIVGGVRSLLILSAREDTPEIRKEMFKQAFTEFITIEPYLKKIDASKTEQIMSDFKSSYNKIKNKSEFITNTMIINRQLKSVALKA